MESRSLLRLQGVLVLLLSLLWSSTCNEDVTYKIAMIPKVEHSDFFLEVKIGCVTEAAELSERSKEYAVICDYIGPTTSKEDDKATQEQIEILEGIISSRSHDGIAISVNDDVKLTPYLNKAVENGIPLITFDSDASESKRYVYVGTNNTAFGDQMAKLLLQINPHGGKFGIISIFSAPNLQERVDGFRSRMRNTGWIEVRSSPKDGEGNTVSSLLAMNDFIAEDPGIRAIIPVGSWPMDNSTGWRDFVEKNRNVTLVIGDAKQNQIDLISKGYGDGLVGQMPYDMGKVSAYELTKIIVDNVTHANTEQEIIFNTNILQIIRVPLVLPDLALENNFLSKSKILNYILFSTVAVVSIAFAFWTYKNGNKRVVRASQPIFLHLILVGTLIMSAAIITLTIDSENHSFRICSVACHLDIWFIILGFTAVFAALFSKAWRVNIIMEQSMRLKRVLVRVKDVMLPFVALLLANVIVLITWTVHSPLHYTREAHPGTDDWNREFSFFGECHSEYSTIYFSVLMVLAAISLFLAMFQTYKTRNYRTEFNESAYIGVAVICISQGFIVGLPVFILTRDQRRIMVPVVSLIIFFTCMSILLFIFVPKILSQRKYDREKKEAAKQTGKRPGVLTRKYLESMKTAGGTTMCGNRMNDSNLEHIPEEVTHEDDQHDSDTRGLKIRTLKRRALVEEEKAEITSERQSADDKRGLSLFKVSIRDSERGSSDSIGREGRLKLCVEDENEAM